MAAPRVLVLRGPGTNCDHETVYAFQQAGAVVDLVHLNRLLENGKSLYQYQVLCLPGGFSYGDDIAAGRIFANQLRHHLHRVIAEFKSQEKLILGICNGFQILLKAGLLLDEDEDQRPAATLAWNEWGRFENRWVHLASNGNGCVFLRGVEHMYLPIAHAEGKFVARDADVLGNLDQNGQLALRYSDDQGRYAQPLSFPDNPNGSQANVAGVCDTTGRAFGLMPHPERHVDPTHHPQWTRQDEPTCDGLAIFQNAVAYFE